MVHRRFSSIPYVHSSYSFSEDPEVNQIVNRHLSAIVRDVKTTVGSSMPLSIVCVGGVSRGETAFLRGGSSTCTRILSDYDFLVAVNSSHTRSIAGLLERASKRVSSEFSEDGSFLSTVHIQPISYLSLRRAPRVLASLDMQQSGVVLFSSSSEPVLMRTLSPDDIRRSDLFELLVNRIEEYLAVRETGDIDRRLYHLSKLVLDMITIVRISQGCFERKYEERVTAFLSESSGALRSAPRCFGHYANIMLAYRKSARVNNAQELLSLLDKSIDVFEREMLTVALNLWVQMLDRSLSPYDWILDTSELFLSKNLFKRASTNHLMRSISIHKCTYVVARMALSRRLAPQYISRLCLVPVHPKVWLNLSLIAWVSYMLSGDEYWAATSAQYLSLLGHNPPNKGLYTGHLEKAWHDANMFIFKP